MNESHGLLFNQVAAEYDRARRGYPEELVDAACSLAGLGADSRIVEVGCGTGKLTRALAERGLRVDAVDPGSELVAIARAHLREAPVRFHLARFEDVDLPAGTYEALFSATAFHWVEPDVAWPKAARLLRPGGVIALLTHVGAFEELIGRLVDGLLEAEPERLAAWQDAPSEAQRAVRDPDVLWEGVDERLGNVSELWAWITRRELARPEAADLFGEVRLERLAIEIEETVDELLALVRTTSPYLRFDADRRRRLEERLVAVVDDAGGTYRSTLSAVLVTARVREGGSKIRP
jgi:SAM-dependent methyltransferase